MSMNYIFIGIATVVALYALLGMVSAPLANLFLTFAIIIGGILIAAYFLLRQKIFTLSIYIVPARYHAGANAITNKSVTVSYFQGERIIVADNAAKNECNKRYFIVKKTATDVDKLWFRTCRIFNRYTTLGSLSEFYRSSNIPIDILVEHDETKPKKRVVEKKEYRAPESYLPKTKTPVPEIVDFNNLQTSNRARATSKDEEMLGVEEFLSMGEIMKKSAQKVNVNKATAGEIAVLHGINIAIAKKIVEHRNLNGPFKTIEEFLEVADVKEHFIPQIKEIITLSDDDNGPGDAPNEGRLIDW